MLNDRRGVVALEFALTLPITLTLLFGTIQFGSMYFIQNTILHTANELAWRLATDKLTPNQASGWVANKLPGYTPSFTVQVTSPDLWDETKDYYEVTITVPMSEAVIVDPFGIFNNFDALRAEAVHGI